MDENKLLYTRKEAAAALGLGMSKFKEELAAGRIRQVFVGTRSLIPGPALGEYVETLEAEARTRA